MCRPSVSSRCDTKACAQGKAAPMHNTGAPMINSGTPKKTGMNARLAVPSALRNPMSKPPPVKKFAARSANGRVRGAAYEGDEADERGHTDQELQQQEPSVRATRALHDHGANRGSYAEERQVDRQHMGEAVRVRPRHRIDHAEEHELETERHRASQSVDHEPRPEPGGVLGPDRLERLHLITGSDGGGSRRRRGPPDQEHQHRGEQVQRAGDARRGHETERALEDPSGEGGAGRCADRVDGVEPADQCPGLLDASDDASRHQREREAHEGGRHQHECGVEAELGRGGPEMLGLGLVDVVEQPDARHGEQPDHEVGSREREERGAAPEAVGEPAAEQVAEPETSEESRDDRGERHQVDAGVQRYDTLPDHLQGEGGKAGDRENDVEAEPRSTPHGGPV